MFRLLRVLIFALFSTAIPVSGQCTTSGCQEFSSRPDEGLMNTFEAYGQRFQSLSSAIEQLNQKLNSFEAYDQRFQSLSSAIEQLNQKLNTFEAYGQRFQSLSSAIEQLNQKLNSSFESVGDNLQYIRSQEKCPNSPVVCDCSEIKANGYKTSGVYRVYVFDQGQRYYANAYCDMTTKNGSWTIFQRRKDGSVDFYREWTDYKNGFGNPNGEFWLGNDFIYLLISKKRYRLRIDLEDFEGAKRFAEYSTFRISSSADKYRLTMGGYSGNAGDSLEFHNNSQFGTKDSGVACAIRNQGAWWYNGCANSNLNGLYLRGWYTSKNCSSICSEGIWWHHWHGYWYSLKTTEMKMSSSVL